MLSLKVFGRFCLIDDAGHDLTPKGVKARGLLALLALTRGHKRSRVWLQDKLWSDRDAKNGADSLRQTLMELRRTLGTNVSALQTTRENIALDPSQIDIIYNSPQPGSAWTEDHDVFCDLNVPDAEFEDWMRNQRLYLGEPPTISASSSYLTPTFQPRENPAIIFRSHADFELASRTAVQNILTLATASLLDFADFRIFQQYQGSENETVSQSKSALTVIVTVSTRLGLTSINVALLNSTSGQIFWTRAFHQNNLEKGAEQERLESISAEIVEAILGTFKKRRGALAIPDCAALFANLGRSLTFQTDIPSLIEADRHMQRAYALAPRPQYLAWRAFLRNFAAFQHRTYAFLDDPVDVNTLSKEAIHQAPDSAIALGVRAHIEYLSGGSQRTSLQLVQRAVIYDPLNAINFAILSNTQLALGNLIESRISALRALALAGSGEHRAYVEFFCCMSAAALGDYQAAIDHAESALIHRPSFRAPLRYLIALYKQVGMAVPFNRHLSQLRQMEPDFQLRNLLDSDYPVTTMRRMRLIDAIAR